jgi:phytoene synthase
VAAHLARSESTRVIDLANSYALCQRQARQSGSNFYYCFYLLPRPKRLAMCALYAFLRRLDDVADVPSTGNVSVDRQRQDLQSLRGSLVSALAGRTDDPLLVALADAVARYNIPQEYLYAALDGVEMDLAGRTYETFDELAVYCHRVASVVGQACIYIWGFTDDAAIELAAQCGMAFQLTNILRDLREDAAGGRIYLPAEDFRRFDYTADDLRRGMYDERFMRLIRFEAERAETFYRAAAGLHAYLYADGRRIYHAMFHTYYRLLQKIRRIDSASPSRRVKLAGWEKLHTAARALLLPHAWPHTLAESGAPVS